MKLKDIFEIYRADPDHSRRDIDWQNEVMKDKDARAADQKYNLVDRTGKVLRVNLSLAAAKALQIRPDLVKTHGKIFLRKI